MSQHPGSVCIATLGSQPQVVTLALDALLAQGEPIDELIVVHLSAQNLRYGAALERLAAEFADECYGGRPCRYRPLLVRLHGQPLADLTSETAADAVRNTFHQLIQQLKQQEAAIHLCPTGGRRLLGMLAISAALLHFDLADRIWHLYSSDEARRLTDQGALLHLPPRADVQLVRVPIPPWGHLLPQLRGVPDADANAALERQTRQLDATERGRCAAVVERITGRQREVLRALAAGRTPQEVAEQLCLSIATVDSHKTTLYDECRNAWNLLPETRLDYHWLREKFGGFFATPSA